MVFSADQDEDPKPYDAQEDPDMRKNVVGEQPESVKRMFSVYVLRDAGDRLPNHWSALNSRGAYTGAQANYRKRPREVVHRKRLFKTLREYGITETATGFLNPTLVGS